VRIVAMEPEVDADRAVIRRRAESANQPLAPSRRSRAAHPDWSLGDLRRRGEE
jgi:hypothetical protein